MPFINSKVTVKMSDEKKDSIKAKLGEAAAIIGKPESYLMVGFEDEYCLYFAGEKLEKGAFVSVDIFGSGNSAAFDRMTAKICEIYAEELGIPGNHIYVEYRSTKDWGWNGSNF
ncbi:MAG: hypothetical protein IKQ49_09425 [Eubacterium sp.]|nr:hypothetical protein [Eubacterium sp.]MBR6173370.1 hypothetical protein [Eubacterium sp.]